MNHFVGKRQQLVCAGAPPGQVVILLTEDTDSRHLAFNADVYVSNSLTVQFYSANRFNRNPPALQV